MASPVLLAPAPSPHSVNELSKILFAQSNIRLCQDIYESYRDRIAAVEQIMQKQKAIVAGGGDQDVIVTQRQQEDALVQMLLVRGGKMIGSEITAGGMRARGGSGPCAGAAVSLFRRKCGIFCTRGRPDLRACRN